MTAEPKLLPAEYLQNPETGKQGLVIEVGTMTLGLVLRVPVGAELDPDTIEIVRAKFFADKATARARVVAHLAVDTRK